MTTQPGILELTAEHCFCISNSNKLIRVSVKLGGGRVCMEMEAAGGLTTKSDSTQTNFTRVSPQPSTHPHLPQHSGRNTRQSWNYLRKEDSSLKRMPEADILCWRKWFTLWTSWAGLAGRGGDNFKRWKVFGNSCADLIISSGATRCKKISENYVKD